jgi:hypothetical protein
MLLYHSALTFAASELTYFGEGPLEKGRGRSSKWPVITLDKSQEMTYHDTHH